MRELASTNDFALANTVTETTDAAASSATSYSISVGDTFSGNLSSAGDRDWVAVTLTAGDSYTISLTGNTLADPFLRLYDSSGNLVASNDDISWPNNPDSQISSFTAAYSGTYYLAAGSYNDFYAGTYDLSIVGAAPLPVFSHDQIADQLTEGYWGGSGQHRAFNVSPGGSISVNISGLTSEGQTLATTALAAWTAVLGITFNITGGSAQITFDDNDSGAYATSDLSGNTINSSFVNVSTNWLATYGTGLNTYSFQTYIHEIGHAIGLGHAGNYNGNATYGSDNHYLNDSWQATVMSYFDQTENTYVDATRAYIFSPMVADILAVQDLYGVATNLHLGNTTYGRNSNAGGYLDQFYSTSNIAMTIVDNGGTDTFDFSGLSMDQVINLNAEVASSVNGETGNLFIARGTVIENAIGGSGNDQLTGNGVANTLTGNGGEDTLNGGGGIDTMIGGAGNDTYYVDTYLDVVVEGAGEGTSDVVLATANYALTAGAQVERLLLLNAQGTENITLIGNEHGQQLAGNNGNNVLAGGGGVDSFFGYGGNDIYVTDREGEVVVEAAGQGYDSIYTSASYTISSGVSIERFVTTSQAGTTQINLVGNEVGQVMGGNAANNSLYGGAGVDSLYGYNGNDFLEGAEGNDALFGGAGVDRFVFREAMGTASGIDRIYDMNSADNILVDALAVSGPIRSLMANEFRVGTAALDADDRIIYDDTSGVFWFDADGNGAGAAILFGVINGAPSGVDHTWFELM